MPIVDPPDTLLALIPSETEMFRMAPGQSKRFSVSILLSGISADVTGSLTLTLQPPAGAIDSPIVDASPVHDATGAYHSDQALPANATPGVWARRWQATGAAAAQRALVEDRFEVPRLAF